MIADGYQQALDQLKTITVLEDTDLVLILLIGIYRPFFYGEPKSWKKQPDHEYNMDYYQRLLKSINLISI